MTLIHWAMLLIGIAIGGLVGCLVVYKNSKDQTEILSALNKFCINYAQIKDHTNKAEMIQILTDLITEHEKINEERWSLIVDYIQNDGPERAEDMKNHDDKDLCDWCKNQDTEKCADCIRPVSNTEVYFVNFEAKEEDKDND